MLRYPQIAHIHLLTSMVKSAEVSWDYFGNIIKMFQIILFSVKLIHLIYLQDTTKCKCFDPLDVEWLLSLLESWTPAPSYTNFKFALKTAAHYTLVMVKCFLIELCYAWIISPISSA